MSRMSCTLSRRRFAATLALAAAWPHVTAAQADAAARLAALAERYYDFQLSVDPVHSGTLNGDNRYDDRLPLAIAPAERAKRFAGYRRLQRELAAIPRESLGSETDRLTHELLAAELERRLGFEPFHDHLLPLHQMDSIPVMLAIFGGGQSEQPLQTAAQYEAYLRRITLLPTWVAQATVNMREGMRRGIVVPKAVAQAALKLLKPMGSDALGTSPFLAATRRWPETVAPADRTRLAARYERAVRRDIAPAMRRFASFVEQEYLPACRDSAGWSALPNGDAWYRQWIRDQTTTDLSPDEIHAMGLREVDRIHGELAKVGPKLGYEGDPRGLLTWVRSQPAFLPFRSEAEVLEAYRRIDAAVRAKLPALFARMPKAPLEIRAEPELTKAVASDHYGLPAEDGSRPGTFWAVIQDPADYNTTGMTALFLHEGQPGHHFHMALQQQMTLPAFRKRFWINAYGEGWALYAETLGIEMGLYEDPAAWVGELKAEIARAARLVVDTGLHAKGWTREQALRYWRDTVGADAQQAGAQIDRYMAWPAQALGYKLGALKIQALRERARTALGERFDIAAFHDAVLGAGCLPLATLEAQVERWIAQRGTRRP